MADGASSRRTCGGRDDLDLCGPATLVIRPRGGEIALDALQTSLSTDYSPDEIGFTWSGCDEMDEVLAVGSAELQNDDSIQIEFEHHDGDEAILKAVREPSSTAC